MGLRRMYISILLDLIIVHARTTKIINSHKIKHAVFEKITRMWTDGRELREGNGAESAVINLFLVIGQKYPRLRTQKKTALNRTCENVEHSNTWSVQGAQLLH